MLNKYQWKALFAWMQRAKTEKMIALAAKKTLDEIVGLYECGLLTPQEFDLLICDMWGDGNG